MFSRVTSLVILDRVSDVCGFNPLIFTEFINDLLTLLRENCRNCIVTTQSRPRRKLINNGVI